MATIQWDYAAITSVMTTELNSLSNGSAALGVEYDNTSNGYTRAILELNVTFGSNPTVGRTCDIYLIAAPDGTNYDDSWNNPAAFKGGIPVQVNTSAQKITLGAGQQEIVIPGLKFKFRLYNNSAVAFPASGSTLKLIPGRLKTV